jgi:hypothetical protein
MPSNRVALLSQHRVFTALEQRRPAPMTMAMGTMRQWQLRLSRAASRSRDKKSRRLPDTQRRPPDSHVMAPWPPCSPCNRVVPDAVHRATMQPDTPLPASNGITGNLGKIESSRPVVTGRHPPLRPPCHLPRAHHFPSWGHAPRHCRAHYSERQMDLNTPRRPTEIRCPRS